MMLINNSDLSNGFHTSASSLLAHGNQPTDGLLDLSSTRKYNNAGLLDEAWKEVQAALEQFSSNSSFSTNMSTAFGENWNGEKARVLFQEWTNDNASSLPELEICSGDLILGAKGAFVGETDTIYISSDFLEKNANNLDAITGVLLEEIGHAIDSKLNNLDAPGDEGNIFSRLAQGENISDSELKVLKLENDTVTISVDGKLMKAEQSSTIETIRNKDGRLETFAIGKDGQLRHRWQNQPNSSWSSWSNMGLRAREFEVARNADGRLEILAIGINGSVWQRWQNSPGSSWGNWVNFGVKATEVELARNQDGRLEAFALGLNNEVMQRWQNQPNGSWSNWGNMGLNALEIEAAKNADGRLELFAIGTNSEVWQRWQTQPSGGWGNWNRMGLQAQDLEVIPNADGRLEMFAVGTDSEVWQRWQTQPNGGWSNWGKVGLKASEVEMNRNQDGRLELFAVATDGEIWQRWQTQPGGGWSNWNKMGLKGTEIESAQNADGRLELLGVDLNGEVWQRWQTQPGGGWSNWNRAGLLALEEMYSPIKPTFQYTVSSTYLAPNRTDNHSGIDLAGSGILGVPAMAVKPGNVVFAGWNTQGYGNLVIVDHGDGMRTYYAHLSSISVRQGTFIPGGFEVGKIGSTGNSTGPHLHFEVRINGVHKNPENYYLFR